jgi:hypothetical protein
MHFDFVARELSRRFRDPQHLDLVHDGPAEDFPSCISIPVNIS